MTLNVTQGHLFSKLNVIIQYVIYHLLLLFCSNDISILRHFQDITSFKVYMTACDLEKSFSFNMKAEITCDICFLIQM